MNFKYILSSLFSVSVALFSNVSRTVDASWTEHFGKISQSEIRPASWAQGGTDSEMCVWKSGGGSSGTGIIGIVDTREDAFASWQSPLIPLPVPTDDTATKDKATAEVELKIRLRHRMKGGRMRIVVRSFDDSLKAISSENLTLSGATKGWNEGDFEEICRTLSIPQASKSIRLWLISGGANVTGEIWLDEVSVSPKWAVADYEMLSAPAQVHGLIHPLKADLRYNAQKIPHWGTLLMEDGFSSTTYGTIPKGWEDLSYQRPSRNWAVDINSFLRPVLKNWNGLIAYEGELTTGEKSTELENYVLRSTFRTTGDADVFFGLAGRIQDKNNFYTVRVLGNERVQILKVEDGDEKLLSELAFLRRYVSGAEWVLEASFFDDLITGIVRDAEGRVVARADGRDGVYTHGNFGFNSSDFAAAANIACYAQTERKTVRTVAEALAKNDREDPVYDGYDLVYPVFDHTRLQTPFNELQDVYDIIVSGAGTGGWAAAVQAAQNGKRVLLLEETDWLGGQMGAAAVTSMDEAGTQVRERGLYRLFHESMVVYYYGMDKSPFNAYYYSDSAQQQMDGGYEPAATQAVLYGLIQRIREEGGTLDLAVRCKVAKVHKSNNRVTGVTVQRWDLDGKKEREVDCRILVDATEYGDVLPVAGIPYRVGNTCSDNLNPDAPLQSHSFNIVFREYPDGIPEHLQMKVPPPNYETERKRFRRGRISGDWTFHKGERNYRILMAWRGAADAHSPITGRLSEQRHTAASTNWSNNYRTTAATIEFPEQRNEDERLGIYRMLSCLYYIQNELGLNWSVAEEQGYDTDYNQLMMEARGIDPAVMPFAKYMCQIPYVRESRRMIGIETLVANDLTRWEKAKHMSSSVAMGDYFIDLHGSYESVEPDLDTVEYPKGTGPFQVPFGVFIPQELDGFLPAEKNFSQSRLVNGATRLQPSTMLIGQAVGEIATQALDRGVQPRELSPLVVQLALVEDGSTLVQRWHSDVEWGTDIWRAVQLLSLYQILDRRGRIEDIHQMRFLTPDAWGVSEPLDKKSRDEALKGLSEIPGMDMDALHGADGLTRAKTRGAFALGCLDLIRSMNEYIF